MKEEKHCCDCKHYREHYIKKGTCFMNISQGHCWKKVKPKYKKDSVCQLYEERDREEERQMTVQSIAKSMSKISRYMKELSLVLKTEELNNEFE